MGVRNIRFLIRLSSGSLVSRMSNRDHADASNFVNIVRDRNSEAHGILKIFDDFLIEHHGPVSDSSSSTAGSSTAEQVAGTALPPVDGVPLSSENNVISPSAEATAAMVLSPTDTPASPPTDDLAPPPPKIGSPLLTVCTLLPPTM